MASIPNFKRTHTAKARQRYEDLSPEEAKALRKYLGKMAKVVRSPKDNYLEGKKAINQKPRYKVVKGPNKEYLSRKW